MSFLTYTKLCIIFCGKMCVSWNGKRRLQGKWYREPDFQRHVSASMGLDYLLMQTLLSNCLGSFIFKQVKVKFRINVPTGSPAA